MNLEEALSHDKVHLLFLEKTSIFVISLCHGNHVNKWIYLKLLGIPGYIK